MEEVDVEEEDEEADWASQSSCAGREGWSLYRLLRGLKPLRPSFLGDDAERKGDVRGRGREPCAYVVDEDAGGEE